MAHLYGRREGGTGGPARPGKKKGRKLLRTTKNKRHEQYQKKKKEKALIGDPGQGTPSSAVRENGLNSKPKRKSPTVAVRHPRCREGRGKNLDEIRGFGPLGKERKVQPTPHKGEEKISTGKTVSARGGEEKEGEVCTPKPAMIEKKKKGTQYKVQKGD